jgi:arsenate reductase (thioredoxin)
VTRVLFVGLRNAGRSQLAAALYEARGGEARSAGCRPAGELYEAVVEALAELDLDVSGRVPRALDASDVEWADLVVTMEGADAGPAASGRPSIHWNVAEPAALCLEEVRELRAVLEAKVAQLPL